MAFTFNSSTAPNTDSELLPVGKYECVIKSASFETSKNGTEYISLELIVRNDVEQKYQNKHIWHSYFKRKTPTEQDNAVLGFSFKQLSSLAKAANIEGTFEGISDFLALLSSKPVLVEIEHNEYNGNIDARVKFVNASKYPQCKHSFPNTASQTQTSSSQIMAEETITDITLPF